MSTNNFMTRAGIIKVLRDTPNDRISVFSPATKETIKKATKVADRELSKASYISIVIIRHD